MCGCGPMFGMGHEGHNDHGEYDAVKHALKAMYARGEIDEQTYHRLKHLAKEGELGWDDVRRLRREGTSAPLTREVPRESPVAEHSAPEPKADAGLVDWLRRRTEQLQEAEEESSALLRELEAKADELRSRLGALEGAADATPSDEGAVQSGAERKLALQQQVDTLESRARELREDLQRIGSLRSELALREQEAKVADSRRRIAALEEVIREERGSSGGQ